MGRMSGWQKAGLIAGAGCLSIIGVIVIGLIVAVGWARSIVGEVGDTTPTRIDRTIAIVPDTALEAGPAAPGGVEAREPMRLTVDLEDGNFTVRAGPPGERVTVQGSYASDLYQLTDTHDPNTRSTTIRFRSTAPQWARMLAGIGDGSDNRPALTVVIPSGAPMDLSLRISMGESRVDLGGLALRDLDLEMSMGEHRVDFQSPVDERVRRIRLNASMGNLNVEHLGNARPEAIEGSGSMGNLTADLGGAWDPGSAVSVTLAHSMGELTLRVPESLKLEAEIRESSAEARPRPSDTGQTDDPNAPVVKLRVSSSMGQTRVVRY